MQLEATLMREHAAIVRRWMDLTLGVYPPDACRFMKREKDRFQNPVGHVTGECLDALFHGLLGGRPDEELERSLDGIVRIRAVQDLLPSQAVGFIFLLKTAVRDVLGTAASGDDARDALPDLYARIDALALKAFDLYVQRREQIYELRARDMDRRTSSLLRRLQGRSAERRDRPADGGPRGNLDGGRGA